ncbi:hypothetical protein G9A89_009967 [Geosiphon pyriformis]|nr:hypothetical protein G9A89_009967 [Geosiphon pyriformis]
MRQQAKKNLETNEKSNQQKLGTPAQTPKKTVMQSLKKQHIYLPKNKSYYFSPENKIQISLRAALLSTLTSQIPKTFNYTDKLKQHNWGNIPITEGYLSHFKMPLLQPNFGAKFENYKKESELETKEPIKEPKTKPVTKSSNQSKNQEEKLDIRKATFRDTQENIIITPLRPINLPAENDDEITTLYIAQLTDFLGEKKETDVHIHALEVFSNPNAVIQLQNKFNTIKQGTGKTVTQYLA